MTAFAPLRALAIPTLLLIPLGACGGEGEGAESEGGSVVEAAAPGAGLAENTGAKRAGAGRAGKGATSRVGAAAARGSRRNTRPDGEARKRRTRDEGGAAEKGEPRRTAARLPELGLTADDIARAAARAAGEIDGDNAAEVLAEIEAELAAAGDG